VMFVLGTDALYHHFLCSTGPTLFLPTVANRRSDFLPLPPSKRKGRDINAAIQLEFTFSSSHAVGCDMDTKDPSIADRHVAAHVS